MDNHAKKEEELTITEHIEELRRRIFISGGAILLAALAAFVFSDQILGLILLPSGGMHLNAFSLLDGFMIKWQVCLQMSKKPLSPSSWAGWCFL